MCMPTLPHALDSLTADARFALRYFARHKATTAILLTVITLSTGGDALIFSLFQSQFVRPAPGVTADNAVVRVWGQERATRLAAWDPRDLSGSEMGALVAHPEIFQSVAAWTRD